MDTGPKAKETNQRHTPKSHRLPLLKIWEDTANINIITDTLKNLEGRYMIAIGFAHEAINTRAGIRIIWIPATSYSTLNQHLQEGRTVAAHEANRSKIRPRPPPIRYSDAPKAPVHAPVSLDMYGDLIVKSFQKYVQVPSHVGDHISPVT
jgi:hypothetical protein